jgi:deoxyribose-phosphate aldolase
LPRGNGPLAFPAGCGAALAEQHSLMPSLPARVDAVMLEARAAVLAGRDLRGEAKRAAIDVALGCLDLTSLEGADTPASIRALCARASTPAPGVRPVAAVCVYPALVGVAAAALRGSGVRIATVAGGFPSGQTSLAIKLAETHAALAAGADEIDVVLDRSAFLAGRYREATAQIEALREACAAATLKVILEVGELGSYAAIRRACDLVLAAGADFVKTATGKLPLSSTPPIALLLCESIRAHERATGRAAGLKLAGGIRTVPVALGYLAIVKETLGDAWLAPARLRIGASSLLDALVRARSAATT